MVTETRHFWHSPAHFPSLQANDIHVWRISLSESPCNPEILDLHETQRLNAIALPETAQSYCQSHCALRRILSGYLNISPAEVLFQSTDTGKPLLQGAQNWLNFNLSHSGDNALVAVAQERALGVDIELQRDVAYLSKVAKRVFSADEYQQLEDSHFDTTRFLQFWTRMEALQKCTGKGIFGERATTADLGHCYLPGNDEQFISLAWRNPHQQPTVSGYNANALKQRHDKTD